MGVTTPWGIPHPSMGDPSLPYTQRKLHETNAFELSHGPGSTTETRNTHPPPGEFVYILLRITKTWDWHTVPSSDTSNSQVWSSAGHEDMPHKGEGCKSGTLPITYPLGSSSSYTYYTGHPNPTKPSTIFQSHRTTRWSFHSVTPHCHSKMSLKSY